MANCNPYNPDDGNISGPDHGDSDSDGDGDGDGNGGDGDAIGGSTLTSHGAHSCYS